MAQLIHFPGGQFVATATYNDGYLGGLAALLAILLTAVLVWGPF